MALIALGNRVLKLMNNTSGRLGHPYTLYSTSHFCYTVFISLLTFRYHRQDRANISETLVHKAEFGGRADGPHSYS